MVQKQNKQTGLMEVHMPALITEIREEVFTLNNQKETPYRLGTTKIKYPDGEDEEVLTRFYTKSISSHPDTFKIGKKINLVIQSQNEYAGRAVAQLPGNLVDISRLLGLKASEGIPLTASRTESIIADNLIEEELVV